MLFSSIVFLYIFLPITVLSYFVAPQKARNFVLFLMSVLFYAWGEPVYVLLMLVQIATAFLLTGAVERLRGSRTGRVFYILSVLLPFAALFYFKYYAFFVQTLFGRETRTLPLPIGISFYTFQIASYCIDVYHQRTARQKNIITFAAYVTLFPQLVAGPIVRYSEIEQTLINGAANTKVYARLEQGIVRFTAGLAKKVLIANVIGEFVAEVAKLEQRTPVLAWAYAIAVSLQIYYDFSGYSDMAIGLGTLFGFTFPENFRYPFIARSVSEFWRRWHITLGAWFRDYVYIPMGGNRVGMFRWICNILVVWLFTGLWHGAGWNFIVWGLMFAVLLVIEKAARKLWHHNQERGQETKGKNVLTMILQHLYVCMVILISFLVFHNEQLSATWVDIQSLAGYGVRAATGSNPADMAVCMYLIRNRIVILCVGLVGSTPLPALLWNALQGWLMRRKAGEGIAYFARAVFAVGLLVLCTAYLIDGSFNPFLYFRF